MVAIYVRLIKSGSMTLERVPALWRAQVREVVGAAETAATDETATQNAELFGNGAGHSPEEALADESN